MTRIFIAHSLEYLERVQAYVKQLEDEGHEVYYPYRDTPQSDVRVVLTCNLKGIIWSEEVHILWNGSSFGTIFDLGCAYALNRPMKAVYIRPRTWHSVLKERTGEYLDDLRPIVDSPDTT